MPPGLGANAAALAPPVIPAPPPDGTRADVVIFEHSVPLPPVNASTPALGPLATVRGQYDGGAYWLEISFPSGHAFRHPLTSAGGLPPFEENLGGLEGKSIGPTPGGTLGLRAFYSWEPDAPECRAVAEDACAPLPFPDPLWPTGPGQRTAFVIEARAEFSDGTVQGPHRVSVPLVGQPLGWLGGLVPLPAAPTG